MRLRSIDFEINEAKRAGFPSHYRRRTRLGMASVGLGAIGAATAIASLWVGIYTGDVPVGIDHAEDTGPSGPRAWFAPTMITASSVAVVGAIVGAWALISRHRPNSEEPRIRELQEQRRRVIFEYKQGQRQKRLELVPGAGPAVGRGASVSWTLRVRF